MTPDDVRRLLKIGELPGAVRSLRPRADTAPVAELATATRALADAAGFEDLAAAAEAAAKRRGDPQALYDLGYACVEHGVAFLAVAPLRATLRLLPDSRPLLAELAEDEHRHAEAAAEIAEADPAADEGDGGTPADPDEAFRAFVTGVGTGWLSAPRDRVASPGPVPGSRFA
ncbi:hypothetical protein [Streptomyces sp. ISL-94]|uniref:hypothetical protein n=1 Tax=Streptomyces sp. ISL-94 TaxID=2819190 RepID=UPI001BE7AB01|nr:hypothetical protein [Streptomyces sp. ISL-94]MBT2477489.1 hypothetical protein [Streptomyces sp. ISL-94]